MNRPSNVVVVLLVGVACGAPAPAPDCRIGADCASGVCTREGRCVVVDGGPPAGGGSAGGSAAGGAGGGSSVGGGATGGGGGGSVAGGSAGGAPSGGGGTSGGGGGAPGCLPNDDGTITRAEVVTGPGLRATFRISGQATFDTAGIGTPDGGRRWDFTGALPGDVNTLVETEPLAGKWFEASYPDGGYVVPLGQGSSLLGVFTSGPDGLYLLGAADPASSALPTRLTYTPPVKVLQFPLREGDQWTTSTVVTGLLNGAPLTTVPGVFGYTRQTYTSSVDRAGTAVTPYSSFPVLRVRTSMEQTVALNLLGNTSFRQYQFVTECFGTVATVRSRDNETSTEFTTAREVRRLSP
ncbi:MAG: hypothetical protein INH41_01695 [Myxococcaceae bacterium]|nr:hypothetical protein [Myxococcaceae bacterium]MCA3011092.1 hypothetical protein [Myxococcaceae bacterium]